MSGSIRTADPAMIAGMRFTQHLADCVVVTQDKTLLLQYRPLHWGSSPGKITLFGGHVEDGETVMQGLIRELHEELGAQAPAAAIRYLGTITEDWTHHTEAVHLHFWQDQHGLITGCYEAEPMPFATAAAALADPRLMDYARHALQLCLHLRLVPA